MRQQNLKNIFKKIFVLLAFLSLTFFVSAEAATTTVGQTPVGQLFTFPWSDATDLNALVKQIYLIALGIIGILAFGMIIFGGIQYSMSAGDPSRQKDARDRITQAIWGVILLLAAFLILNTINPDLIKLTDPTLKQITSASISDYIPDDQLTDANQQAESHNTYLGHTASGAGIINGGNLNSSRSITQVGGQYVQGHYMSTEAAQNLLRLANEISAKSVGGASIRVTSTVTGQHQDKCHNMNDSAQGGTCADFVVVFGSGVTNKSYALNQVREILKSSKYVHSCLDEYLVSTKYSTGSHFHCNF